MNKTYLKTIRRTIRSTFSRFLSIFAIVALGVGFLSGLMSTTPDMRLSADTYCDDTNMMDLRILSTLGLTDADLDAVRGVDGIAAVQPAYDTDVLLRVPTGATDVTRMHSLPADLSADNAAWMNRLVLVDGRMPEQPGECVVVQSSELQPVSVVPGDVLTFDPANEDPAETFAVSQFTVVGIAKSAYYMSVEREHSTLGSGTVDMIAYTPESSFCLDVYTAFYLTVENALPLGSFGSAYDTLVGEVADRLEALGTTRSTLRYNEVITDADRQLADAKSAYADAKQEADEKLADAAQKLADARRELADGEQTLADAKQAIEDGQRTLDDSKDQLAATVPGAQQAIADGWAKIDDGKAQIAVGRAQISDVRAALAATDAQLTGLEGGKAALFQLAAQLQIYAGDDYSDAAAQAILPGVIAAVGAGDPAGAAQFSALQSGLNALAAQGQTCESARSTWVQGTAAANAADAQLNAQEAALSTAAAQLTEQSDALDAQIKTAQAAFIEADETLLDARREYADGVEKLADARQKLTDGERDYNDAKAQADEKLADGAEQIADAESDIREIENCEWYVFDRSSNLSFASYASNADKIEAIAQVFPVFFFLVAALVVLTTMTRMVEDERGQIGTLKALGYTNSRIMAKYLLYAGVAGVLGSACGLAIGVRLFPSIIIKAYNIMYEIPAAITPFNPLYGLSSAAVMIFCALLATFSACRAELAETPALLMLPRAPKAGKRVFLEYITPLWRRMKFTHKVTARNLIRYKKRFFMTVIGIAGCTALLVTGFGIKDSISDIVSKQFDELYNYNLIVGMKDPSALAGRELNALLCDESRVRDWIAVLQEDGTMVPAAGKPADAVYLLAPSDNARYNDFFNFRHRTDGATVTFDDNAVIISEKLAERQGLSVGDSITVKNKNDVSASFIITDICENYIHHYLFISQAAYKNAFGTAPQDNVLLCDALGDSRTQNAFTADLLQCRDISGVQFTSELAVSFSNSIRSINSIVVVLIISAGALAFVVLYNLTNINITEREKELATIKVLGFYEGEVASYIFRETRVLTLIGILAGLGGGVFLHQFVIRTAEIDLVMFGRSIYAPSYGYAAILTVLFACLVDLAMRRKLVRISMVESLKAPE